jgi:hypothetical protein
LTPAVTLLGPQRKPTLGRVLDSLDIDGPIATINAGWQEREADDGELLSLHGGRGINLRLHARWMDVLASDPDYARAEREHHGVLAELQQLYRLRLDYAIRAAYEIAERTDGHPRVRERAVDDAIDSVREIDARHLHRVQELGDAFEAAWSLAERETIAKHRHEVKETLTQAQCLTMAGGHVGELLHVLRLFDVAAVLPARIVAWSAGAMTLTDRVVLFHDYATQGPAPSEVLANGLGVVTGTVVFPHARKRLRVNDDLRMSILERRFAPATCVRLDEGARVDLDR